MTNFSASEANASSSELDYGKCKSWPFEEARKILKRVQNNIPEKGYVLLETGYGASGLPHIGTFGEVARTAMVKHAFETISDIPTRLFSFSDDMDGLRKVPDNVPNKEMLAEHLGKPLTSIPDPFEQYESFGHHNNAMLRRFLDSFGFDYEFKSSTIYYKDGKFDKTLLEILNNYDKVMDIILPTLRSERRKTYSPFLPICPRTGVVLQVPMEEVKIDAGTVVYKDTETSELVEVPVTGGHCKLQWKVDWAMRWRALDVDYEMSGKDLIDSVRLSGQICKTIGGRPPESLTYEMFLDEKGEKISKSKGNGITIDEWLKHAPTESLSYYMFQTPRKAKRLHFDVIPKCVDEYLSFITKYQGLEPLKQADSPVWHIHNGNVPEPESNLTFALLLNLASVCNTEDPAVLWGFVSKYDHTANPKDMPFLDDLIKHALCYYRDFVKPNKHYRDASAEEAAALADLVKELEQLTEEEQHDPASIQTHVYEIGKKHGFTELREWFKALYEILLGQTQGPRIGSFIALYGVDEMVKLIRSALAK